MAFYDNLQSKMQTILAVYIENKEKSDVTPLFIQ